MSCNHNCKQGRNCQGSCISNHKVTKWDWLGVVMLGLLFGAMFALSC